MILPPLHGQNFGLKTNVLYDFTTTFSLGAEIGLSKKTSLDISGAYNPWEFSDVKRMKLWLVQPEFRYWFCERLNGHFLGLHAHAGQYNFSGINFSEKMKYGNYQGNFYGGGISYGYQWILNSRLSASRTQALKNYLQNRYSFDNSLFNTILLPT